MLPRRFRLMRGSLFPKTMSSGTRLFANPCVMILGLKRLYHSPTPTRIGFVVSKKVSNRASRRNRIRRRLREVIRKDVLSTAHYAKIEPYAAVVLIARQRALEASFSEIRDSILKCLNQLPEP